MEKGNKMEFSNQYLQKLQSLLRCAPLADGEVRHIEWMGQQYITQTATPLDDSQYDIAATVTIDGSGYHLLIPKS